MTTKPVDERTPVIFRRLRKGGLIALFPTMSSFGKCACFDEDEKLSYVDYRYTLVHSRSVRPDEYADLEHHLRLIGYDIKPYKSDPQRKRKQGDQGT